MRKIKLKVKGWVTHECLKSQTAQSIFTTYVLDPERYRYRILLMDPTFQIISEPTKNLWAK
jgi:hypothetical protein